MNERELREALKTAASVDPAARERARRVVAAAYEDYQPRRARRWPAALVAAVLMAVGAIGATAAAAPDSGVGHFVRHVLGIGKHRARPALVRLPGAGRLLVQAGGSVWVVSSDGTKRRLGAYSGASWSPRGLFAIAWRDGVLTAVSPAGDVRWSVSRPEMITSARWAPGDGFRIAYVTGAALRIINGDGTGDHLYGPARSKVAPAWQPHATHRLAYVDQRDRVVVAAVDARRRLWRSRALPRVSQLAWSPDGRRLLVLTPRRASVLDAGGRPVVASTLPPALTAEHAAWAPRGPDIALVRHNAATGRSDLMLLDASHRLGRQQLFSGPGRFGTPVWSPDRERLLLPWPDADQWLFLAAHGGGRPAAVANIARQFSPGLAESAYPGAVEWCCPG